MPLNPIAFSSLREGWPESACAAALENTAMAIASEQVFRVFWPLNYLQSLMVPRPDIMSIWVK
jgi:hypothetical protein